jgi:hypothetical protein
MREVGGERNRGKQLGQAKAARLGLTSARDDRSAAFDSQDDGAGPVIDHCLHVSRL